MKRLIVYKRIYDGFIAAGVVCWILAGAPAQACPGQPKPAMAGAAISNAAAMAKLAAHPPATSQNRERDAATASPQAAVDLNGAIVGLWNVSYLQAGQVVDQGFESWHADGTELLVDTSAPATDNVCSGVWVQTGSLTYKLTHPSWNFDMSGNLVGTVLIRNVITMDPSANKYTGTFTLDVFDTTGNLVDHEEGQIKGTRILPD